VFATVSHFNPSLGKARSKLSPVRGVNSSFAYNYKTSDWKWQTH